MVTLSQHYEEFFTHKNLYSKEDSAEESACLQIIMPSKSKSFNISCKKTYSTSDILTAWDFLDFNSIRLLPIRELRKVLRRRENGIWLNISS